MPFVDTAYN